MRPRTFNWTGLLRVSGLAALFTVLTHGPSAVILAQSGPPPLTPFRGLIDHVSANQWAGLPAGTTEIGPDAISGDGRYVVMQSNASDLVPDDFNWTDDVFLRDRTTGTTTRVSVADQGGDSNGMSLFAAISTNGRHVAFASGASNLVPEDTNDVWDIFVRDLDQNRTVRVSVATDGAQGDADSYFPAISADGRFVAFTSWAITLVPGGDPNQPMQAYLHDRDADGNGLFDEPGRTSTTLVSVSSTGSIADAYVVSAHVSGDGRFVLFESAATNLDPVGNPNQSNHLYLRDRQASQTMLIDRAVTGGPSAWGVGTRTSDMSDDGRFITYTSISHDIVPLDMNWQSQVFRYDAMAAPASSTSIVTALPDGTLANGSSYSTSVNGDGRYVAFTTSASNLATPAPGPGTGAVMVRDMLDGTFTRVDVIDSGAPFDHVYPYYPALSADGTAVAFESDAVNAVDGQFSWGAYHIFVATAFAAAPAAASYPTDGGIGSIDVNTTTVSGWNAISFDPWIMLTEGGGFGAGPRTIQYQVDSNTSGVVRDGRIRLGSKIVAIHQDGDGDTTPPVITPIVTGTVGGDGWYVDTVTVQWSVSDPDSPITSQSYNCSTIVTIDTDAVYAPVTCEATSHGGSNSNTVVIRRDTTAPTIAITTPAPTAYIAGSTVTPAFSCTDTSGYSGVVRCNILEGSSPLDTTPGRHTFTVTTLDNAGNSATKSVEYFVGTGTCVVPNDSLAAWWRFENDTLDALGNLFAAPAPSTTLQYAAGLAGQSWQAQSTSYLDTFDGQRLLAWNGLTVAAWVKATGYIGESATLVAKPAQYRIGRYPDGTLRWAFSQTTGYDWVNTGVVIPSNVWTHIAVSYDAGLVKTYLNGRLAHSRQLSGTLTNAGDWSASMTIGGRADANASYFGWLDELEVYTSPLSAGEIEALALAGNGSSCAPKSSTMTISVPATVGYGATFPATLTLRDDSGNPIAGKSVVFSSYVSPDGAHAGVASGTTDAAGQFSANVPIASSATVGNYSHGVTANFMGDARFTPSQAASDVTVVQGTPAITWPSPAPIVYGTALGGAQLNASANTAGTFAYSPAEGTILAAGTRTLSVTFTPSDSERWTATDATTTLVVNKATPVVTITGGTFTYDTQPHPGVATAAGVLGEALAPVQIYYNNTSQTPPVGAGFNWVSAYYAGSANYTSGFASNVPLVINKAVPAVTITGGPFTYNGQSRSATVTVRGAGGDYLSPYGVFYDGGSTLPVQAGAHTVTVQYNGDYNHEAVTVSGSLVIDKATPIMSLFDVMLTYDGQPHGVAVNVAGVNNEWLTPVVVTYNGSTTAPSNAGTYTIDARYDGSTNYTAISRTSTLTILKAAPYVTWSTPASIVYGTALGATQLNAMANVAGTFAYSPPAGTVLHAGSPTLAVTFTPSDTNNYTGASATRPLTVTRAPLTIAANDAAKPYGAPLPAFSATGSGFVNGDSMAVLSGTLSFATSATAASPVGSYPVTPQGLSSADYSVAFANGTLTVVRASTAVWLAASPNPDGLNQAVTFTAAVSVVAPGAGSPTGIVQFFDGATLLGGVTLAGGSASLTTNGFSAGTHAISATYSGDAAFDPGSASGGLVVNTAAASSTTAVTSSANPATAGQSVTLTATVTATGSLSGSVEFYDGATLLGTALLSGTTARFTTAALASGGHAITARYLGNATVPPSTSPAFAQHVQPSGDKTRTSTVTLAASPSPATLGSNVTLTATVTVQQSRTPTGQVMFMLNGSVLGQGTLNATGPSSATATFSTSTLPHGTHKVEAVYLGDAMYRARTTSNTLVVN